MISKETRNQIQNLIGKGQKERKQENKCFSSQAVRDSYYNGWMSALRTLNLRLGKAEEKELEEMQKEVEK